VDNGDKMADYATLIRPTRDVLESGLLDPASYLIEKGPVLKDGDTIGPDEATKIIVRH